jgi:hypothetical protein
MNLFPNMRVNGNPSAADLAKTTVPNDEVEQHTHGPFGTHPHGKPSFTPAEIEYLQQRGWHPDTIHGIVYDSKGSEIPPLLVGSALQQARAEGELGPASSEPGNGGVTKGVSGPWETAPVVRFLDLTGRWNSGPR